MISRGVRAIVALSMASALVSCAAQAPESFAPGPAARERSQRHRQREHRCHRIPDPWPRPSPAQLGGFRGGRR